MNDAGAQAEGTKRKASWISLGFEELVDRIANGERGSEGHPFDVLVVGSGYGGAVAASVLAGCTIGSRPVTVCVLERGQEYLEGAFPDSVDELAGHVRFSSGQFPRARGNLDALFDLRLGEDLNVMVANGLGGGSLINAGVMLKPDDGVLAKAFPDVPLADWPRLFDDARRMLGTDEHAPGELPQKAKVLRDFAPDGGADRFHPAPITVALQHDRSSANVRLKPCIQCGDCVTGCNHGAKDSLDLNLLASAASRGAAIYTGATVLKLSRLGAAWQVHAVPTDGTLRERHGPATVIHAARVILAAGTLGSTELLLKSRTDHLRFSARLGRNFSGNGDMIAVIRGHKKPAHAVPYESTPPDKREVGPTISSYIDLRDDPERPYLIQEMAIPAALRRLFEEVTSTASLFNSLNRFDWRAHGKENAQELDPFAVDPDKVEHSSVIAMMGDDGADGVIELRTADMAGDAQVSVRWPQLRAGASDGAPGSIYDRQMKVLEALASKERDAEVLANPLWRLLPADIEFLFDSQRGPPLTVHPLGGCPVGRDSIEGVVDSWGRVFDPDGAADEAVHDGLVVLDGSVIPRALAVNPSLTIAAFALRAVRGLRDRWWAFNPPAQAQLPERDRPVLLAGKQPAFKLEPKYEIRERLGGPAWIRMPGSWWPWRRRYVEVTLWYRPFPMSDLTGRLRRRLTVSKGWVRVFESESRYQQLIREHPGGGDLEQKLDKEAKLAGKVAGRLLLLHRERSTGLGRIVRGVFAWAFNRGWRDVPSAFFGKRPPLAPPASLVARFVRHVRLLFSLFKVASHAGECRLFEYKLVARANGHAVRIIGCKRLTYELNGNLWQQLERMKLKRFDSWWVRGRLDVDMSYFAAQRTPLLRVAEQPNMPAALIDLGAFGAYIARLFVSIHAWSFRRPDTGPDEDPQRLPQAIERTALERLGIALRLALAGDGQAAAKVLRTKLPAPAIVEIPMGERFGVPGYIRLTRFPRESTEARPPVLLLHGYAASGTTFAHRAVRPALGEYLSYQGRDVWILDMRTSSGMDTAALPWTFEDVAFEDIPVAITHVLERTGRTQLDVVAHCMGSAMFSMAVLAAPDRGAAYYHERRNLKDSIRCAVLSQVGPLMQFSPLNVLRAYVMRYVRYYFGLEKYDLRVPRDPKLSAQLMDRFLSTLRYPWTERLRENFAWNNGFVGTRHRLDGLYARTFSLWNLSSETLGRMDDFFGPIHLETVSQTLHFALNHRVSDSSGRACYLSRESRDRRWIFDTLTVHGVRNGVLDVATCDWIGDYFNTDPTLGARQAPPLVRQCEFPTAGHQDSLIGRAWTTAPIFRSIEDFLEASHAPHDLPRRGKWRPQVPWAGPVWAPPAGDPVFALSGNPGLGVPDFALAVPVRLDQATQRYQRVGVAGEFNTPEASVFLLAVATTDRTGWHRIVLPERFFTSQGVEGVLILHCYDNSAVANLRAGAAAQPFGALHRQDIVDVIGTRAVEVNLAANDGPKGADALLKALNAEESLEDVVAKFLGGEERSVVEEAYVSVPVETQSPIRIFAGSCQYPQGILDECVAWRSYEALGRLLDALGNGLNPRRALMLLVGDQVYADATAGLFDPTHADDMYRQPYEDLFHNKAVRKVLRSIPSAFMLDDHEVRDNWEPGATGLTPEEKKALEKGVAAYKAFQRRAMPVPATPPHGRDALWFTLRVGAGVPLFVADTRTDRLPRGHGACDTWSIMGDAQLGALLDWLSAEHLADACVPKLVACPAMLLPRKLAATRTLFGQAPGVACTPGVQASDSWQGFPASLGKLLAHIVEKRIGNIVFIGGDEHLFCDATISVSPRGAEDWTEIRAIHASPLYAPYPFANSRPEEFLASDAFTFAANGRQYDCRVDTRFHPEVANGFVEMELAAQGGRWVVDVTFHGGEAQPLCQFVTSPCVPAAAPARVRQEP